MPAPAMSLWSLLHPSTAAVAVAAAILFCFVAPVCGAGGEPVRDCGCVASWKVMTGNDGIRWESARKAAVTYAASRSGLLAAVLSFLGLDSRGVGGNGVVGRDNSSSPTARHGRDGKK